MRLVWANCKIRAEDPAKDPDCELPVTSRDLQIRIMGPGMAKRIGASRESLGSAWVANGSGSLAAVYYHRVLDLEKGNLADRVAILGCALAHEIGHLLLGHSRHSNNGIMRASWGDKDLRRMAKGRLLFTADQARQIASKVAGRSTPRGASLQDLRYE
ncbi:MAG: hypothetical protein GY953_54585 [bacterium]|nr:hypothetical protein [bacterium]